MRERLHLLFVDSRFNRERKTQIGIVMRDAGKLHTVISSTAAGLLRRERAFDAALRRQAWQYVKCIWNLWGKSRWEQFRQLTLLRKSVFILSALVIFHFGIGLWLYLYESAFQLAHILTPRRVVSEFFFLARSGRCVFPIAAAIVALKLTAYRPRLSMAVLVCTSAIMLGVAYRDLSTEDWDYAHADLSQKTYLTWWWASGS